MSLSHDPQRLALLTAVLEKKLGVTLYDHDIFLNIAGGIKVDDPAIDLAVAAAVLSSNADLPIDKAIALSAEVGLSGELRPVNRIDQRISEAEKLGFKKIIISKYNKGISQENFKIELVKCGKLTEVVKELFA